jgi:HD-GYP domain-containing protein (c-di-GMP phosphodiesterase class II)
MPTETADTVTERVSRCESGLEHAQQVAELHVARSLIAQLAANQRLLHIYKPNNDAVMQAGDALIETLKSLFEMFPSIEMRFWRDCIFINGNRMRCDVSNFTSYKHLLARSARLEIEKIIFASGLPRDEAIDFLCELDRCEEQGLKGQPLQARIESGPFEHISVVHGAAKSQELEDLGIESQSQQERAKRAFYAALGSTKEVLMAQTSQGAVSLRKAKRAVQTAADALLEDESSVLALAIIKDHDEYTFTHSVNVCIFSLTIGQRLGLHRSWLGRLGMAALFHDIGKVAIPTGVLNKVGVLDVDEWKAIRLHTLLGVRRLSQMPSCNEHMLHSIIVAFQHHLNMDMSGYPNVPPETSLDLFSRIVRIADTFDAMTTERPYRNKVYSPHDAIRYLVAQAGTKFDPVLVKAFAGAMGIFPVGTVLRLNTGELGIVVRRSELSGDPDRAMIRVIVDGDGSQATEERYIDLGVVDPGTGEFVYSVVDALSCKDVGVDPRDYLMA